MIYSMTAFAREQTQNDLGEITFELRSVNHRYLEVAFRLPEMFRFLESDMRSLINQYLQRGKIDVSLNYSPALAISEIKINSNVLQSLVSAIKELQNSDISFAQVDPLAVLKWPGISNGETVDDEKLSEKILASLKKSLESLKKNRAREGAALAKIILEKVHASEIEVNKVKQLASMIVSTLREKLYEKIKAFAVDVDSNRLEQELVLQSQKADITEELDRLTTHLKEVENIITQGGVIGRKLDFLMQELNREANTLSSKSTSIEATNAAVELKVLIEQMREQIQNIE